MAPIVHLKSQELELRVIEAYKYTADSALRMIEAKGLTQDKILEIEQRIFRVQDSAFEQIRQLQEVQKNSLKDIDQGNNLNIVKESMQLIRDLQKEQLDASALVVRLGMRVKAYNLNNQNNPLLLQGEKIAYWKEFFEWPTVKGAITAAELAGKAAKGCFLLPKRILWDMPQAIESEISRIGPGKIATAGALTAASSYYLNGSDGKAIAIALGTLFAHAGYHLTQTETVKNWASEKLERGFSLFFY
jgi:hypothetical protein